MNPYQRYQRKHREKRRPLINKAGRAYRKRTRQLVIEKYGGKCACCGETTYEFLGIDHVNGGGTAERQKLTGIQIYIKLKNNDVMPEYQLLCHNCNMAKGFYGQCPHQR